VAVLTLKMSHPSRESIVQAPFVSGGQLQLHAAAPLMIVTVHTLVVVPICKPMESTPNAADETGWVLGKEASAGRQRCEMYDM